MASAKVVVQNGNQSNNWLLDSIGLSDLARMNKRQVLYQFLNFLMIVSSALMIWKGLMVVTKSERCVTGSPIWIADENLGSLDLNSIRAQIRFQF